MFCYGWKHKDSYALSKMTKAEQEFIIDLDKGKCETCLYEEDCKWGAKR
jgi:hypothetical protein